jgi:hypothetical protein
MHLIPPVKGGTNPPKMSFVTHKSLSSHTFHIIYIASGKVVFTSVPPPAAGLANYKDKLAYIVLT